MFNRIRGNSTMVKFGSVGLIQQPDTLAMLAALRAKWVG
jgi:hypothetical protein